jgi:hypothetical protein
MNSLVFEIGRAAGVLVRANLRKNRDDLTHLAGILP